MPRRQCDQLCAPKDEKWLASDEKRACASLDECCEGRVEVVFATGLRDHNLLPEDVRGRLHLCDFGVGPRIVGMFKHADHRGFRHYFIQQLQAFWGKLDAYEAHTRNIAARPVETGD